MSQKNKKQFGVWMDTHHATVVRRTNADTADFNINAISKPEQKNYLYTNQFTWKFHSI